jgi:hypothetical protein
LKNIEIKTRINNAMMVKVGEVEIEKIKPLVREADDIENLRY